MPSLKSLIPGTKSGPAHKAYTPNNVTMLPRGNPFDAENHQVNVRNDLQTAYKSLSYNQYVQDFIADGNSSGDSYSEIHLESAYRTSVQLFSALRRVANLFSHLTFAAEKRRSDGEWERLPNSHPLNRIIETGGSKFLYNAYIYYAMYGKVLIYKRKTIKAKEAESRGKNIWYWGEGAISGIHIVPNAHWQLREDTYSNEIMAFDFYNRDDDLDGDMSISRKRGIYWNDFDPRQPNRGISMVSLALNNAVTNAAIARWAAHYFMSGAMPLLLVTPAEGEEPIGEVELKREKSFFEKVWRGMWGNFNLRAVFSDRRYNVEEAGITADKVQAPELNQDSLNAITAVFQIAPDLIVPPQGGSDNARHGQLVLQAYRDAVIPPAGHFASALTEDIIGGDVDREYRYVVAEDEIEALNAERADRAATEVSVFDSGIQNYGDTQDALMIEQDKRLAKFIKINDRFQSPERVLRDDKLPNADYLQHLMTAWNDGALKRSEIRGYMGLKTWAGDKDGYKYEVVVEPVGGGGFSPFGGNKPATPLLPDGGPDDQGTPPQQDEGVPKDEANPAPAPPKDEGDAGDEKPVTQANGDDVDGDKATQVVKLEDMKDDDGEEDDTHPSTPVEQADTTPTNVEIAQPETEEYTPQKDNPAYTVLRIQEDSILRTIQEQLAATLGDVPGLEWEDPEHWHCTLVTAPDIDDPTLKSVIGLMPKHLEYLPLRIDGLQTFVNDGKVAITLLVELDDDLAGLQSRVRSSFEAQQVGIGIYSLGGYYTPHITLAYAPANQSLVIPEFATRAIVVPNAITVTRKDFEEVHVIVPAQAKYDVDPNALESRGEYERSTELRRRQLRAMVRQWNVIGALPDTMPELLADTMNEALKSGVEGDVMKATLSSINDGYFDEHSVFVDNPIVRKLVERIQAEENKATQPNAQAEIKAWRRFALSNGLKAGRFEAMLMPLAVENYIRGSLKAIDATDRSSVMEVFNEADRIHQEETRVDGMNENFVAGWAARMDEMDNDDLKSLTLDPEKAVDTA